MFVVQKDNGVIPHVLTQILDTCVNGVTLTDPDLEDSPLVYSNKAFEDMTRLRAARKSSAAIAGSCRAGPRPARVGPAARCYEGRADRGDLAQLRRNGELFYNRLVVKPLFDNKGRTDLFSRRSIRHHQQVKAQEEIDKLSAELNDDSKRFGGSAGSQRPASRTAEPVISQVFPVAAGIVVGDENRCDEFRILEAEFGRECGSSPDSRISFRRIARKIQHEQRLRMQRGRHVDAREIFVGAAEAHVACGEIGADALEKGLNGTPPHLPIALQPSTQTWRVICVVCGRARRCAASRAACPRSAPKAPAGNRRRRSRAPAPLRNRR